MTRPHLSRPYLNFPKGTHWFQFGLTLALAQIAIVFSAQPLSAQITPDDTLGAERSVVIDNNTINGAINQHIEGGAARGTNLFHSFEDFNINTGQQVYFINPDGIETIFSRITGQTLSNIEGRLGVEGAADLFLLNPNGIVFGPNAELDIKGSFTASTGGSVDFSDGGIFSALTPAGTELLTMGVPLGVQRGTVPGADITNGGNLSVGTQQTLTLFGDTVLNSGRRVAPGGTVAVLGNRVGLVEQAQLDVSGDTGGGDVLVGGAYQGQGTVPSAERTYVGPDAVIRADALNTGEGGQVVVWADGSTQFTGNISAQGGPQGGNGGFVEVSGQADLAFAGQVNTQAVQGQVGHLSLDPTNITIAAIAPDGFTTIEPGNGSFSDFLYGADEDPGQNTHLTPGTVLALLDANNLILEATDTIAVTDNVSQNNSRDLTLRASTIRVENARLGQGGGGDIILETPQAPGGSVLVNDGQITTNTSVNGGDVQITTHDLTIQNNGRISANLFGDAEAGTVRIDATGEVAVTGKGSAIRSDVGFFGSEFVGNSGGIVIDTNNLLVEDGAIVRTDVFSRGRAGAVEITATGDVTVDGTGSLISSEINGSSTGRSSSGDVNITANNLSVQNNSAIRSNLSGQGTAGSVNITTNNNLSLSNGGRINASIFGIGNGAVGSVNVVAGGNVEVDGKGSIITSQVATNDDDTRGTGNSEGISITASNLAVSEGGRILADTFGQGTAGPVDITTTVDVTVDGEDASISSQVNQNATGESSGIRLVANNLSVLNGARINANTFGQGTAGPVAIATAADLTVQGTGSGLFIRVGPSGLGEGNLSIVAESARLSEGAELSAESASSQGGGNIRLDVGENIFLQDNSFINASSTNAEAGDGGNIDLTLDGGFLLATPGGDNDIIANSVGGNGGNINIRAFRVFGFTLQDESDTAALRSNQINDISASSELGLNGQIGLDTLTIDPNQGLNDLPDDVEDPANRIARGCQAENNPLAERPTGDFVITGRGGQPPAPTDAASHYSPLDDLGPLVVQAEPIQAERSQSAPTLPEAGPPVTDTSQPAPTTSAAPLSDAQATVITPSGDIFLVAKASWHPSISCAALQQPT